MPAHPSGPCSSSLEKCSGRRHSPKRETQLQQLQSITNALKIIRTHQLIDQWETATGDQLFTVRAALAEHIRHLIKIVRMFPAGHLTTEEPISELRGVRDEIDMPPADVEAHVQKDMLAAPTVQNVRLLAGLPR